MCADLAKSVRYNFLQMAPPIYGDDQFANLSAPFQSAMPLDTHESAKSSSVPSSPIPLSNYSQLALSADLAAAS